MRWPILVHVRQIGRGWAAVASVTAALASAPPLAHADPVRAEALFQQGRVLMERGDFERACARFEESLREDSAVGTLLNLATCNERRGRLASAWVQYRAVATRSRGSREDRVDLAEARMRELEPRLSRLTILVDARGIGEVEVRLDGTALTRADWGKPLEVDGGPHEVVVTAPSRRTTTTRVQIASEREARTVTVVPGERIPAPTPSAQPSPELRSTPMRTVAWTLAGLGLVTAGTGATFGVLALTTDASRPCAPSCPAGSEAARLDDERFERANAFANVANVTIPVGLLLAGAGALLFLADKPSAPKAAIGPRAFTLEGSF